MSGKKVTFGTKPQAEKVPLDPDAWVSGGAVVGSEAAPETPPSSTASLGQEAEEDTAVEAGVPIETEKMKRLTIDIPPALHTRIKVECAQRQKKIADIVRQLLEQEFPAS